MGDSSVATTHEALTDELRLLPTSADLWQHRKRALGPGGIHDCRCKLGELFRLAAESQPDICARLALLAAKETSLQASDVYRVYDLIRTARQRQAKAISTFNSYLDINNTFSAGWSDAAYGGKSEDGR